MGLQEIHGILIILLVDLVVALLLLWLQGSFQWLKPVMVVARLGYQLLVVVFLA